MRGLQHLNSEGETRSSGDDYSDDSRNRGTDAALSAPETCTELCTDLSELHGSQRTEAEAQRRFRIALDLTWRNFKTGQVVQPTAS